MKCDTNVQSYSTDWTLPSHEIIRHDTVMVRGCISTEVLNMGTETFQKVVWLELKNKNRGHEN